MNVDGSGMASANVVATIRLSQVVVPLGGEMFQLFSGDAGRTIGQNFFVKCSEVKREHYSTQVENNSFNHSNSLTHINHKLHRLEYFTENDEILYSSVIILAQRPYGGK